MRGDVGAGSRIKKLESRGKILTIAKLIHHAKTF